MDTFKQLVAFVLIAAVAFFFGQAYGKKVGWEAGRTATVNSVKEYYRTNPAPITVVAIPITNTIPANAAAPAK